MLEFIIISIVIVFLYFIFGKKNNDNNNSKSLKTESWTRDKIIGMVCGILDREILESEPEIMANGKIVILKKYGGVGWIGEESAISSDAELLLDLKYIDETDKTLLNLFLTQAKEDGGSNIVLVDMIAMLIHKSMKLNSSFYRGLKFQDPRLT